jgi:hypothetical protein
MTTAEPLVFPGAVGHFQRAARALGIVFLVITLGLGVLNPDQAFRAYLFAFLFWCGVALGCLSLSMIHNLTGGIWGLVIRRLLEAGTRTFPVLAILFLPLAFGLKTLYVWANPEAVAADKLLQHQSLYLNVPFFLVRAVCYFATWTALAHFLNKWSLELDPGPDLKRERLERSLGGGGLVLLGLTITFSAVDWAMSLNPHWFSTIWGVKFMVGQVLSALCLMVVLLARLGQDPPLKAVVTKGAVHDLGKLMLAFTMLWAYIHLSQFLIIWAGNIAEETPFYLTRLSGGWEAVAFVLLLFHFALPFLLLLSRDLKRNARTLATLAGAMFALRLVDLYWLIGPDLAGHGHGHEGGGGFHVLFVTAVLGLGGAWLAELFRQLKDRPILPVGDPEIRELLRPNAAEAH